MSPDEYTPDEETVREQYSREQPPHIGTVGEKRAEFDRFLARVRRDAWDEGWGQGMAYILATERGTGTDHAITNPYKETP